MLQLVEEIKALHALEDVSFQGLFGEEKKSLASSEKQV